MIYFWCLQECRHIFCAKISRLINEKEMDALKARIVTYKILVFIKNGG